MEDTDRMLEACERNGAILSVDHTRRFLPIWRYCKEQLVDAGAIGEIGHGRYRHYHAPLCVSVVILHTKKQGGMQMTSPPMAIGEIQYIISRLNGPRSMMWRNGTHNIDAMLWFGGPPKWVMGDFEDGFEDYDRYGQVGRNRPL